MIHRNGISRDSSLHQPYIPYACCAKPPSNGFCEVLETHPLNLQASVALQFPSTRSKPCRLSTQNKRNNVPPIVPTPRLRPPFPTPPPAPSPSHLHLFPTVYSHQLLHFPRIHKPSFLLLALLAIHTFVVSVALYLSLQDWRP